MRGRGKSLGRDSRNTRAAFFSGKIRRSVTKKIRRVKLDCHRGQVMESRQDLTRTNSVAPHKRTSRSLRETET